MFNKKAQGMAIAIVFSIFLIVMLFIVFSIIFHFADTKIEHRISGIVINEQADKIFYDLISKDVNYKGEIIKFSDLVRISIRDNDFSLLTEEVDKHLGKFKWYFAPNVGDIELNSFTNMEDYDGKGFSEHILAGNPDIKIKFLVKNE